MTEAGLATNVSVGIRYIAAWLAGTGAAAIDNLMEDAATAEISRSQVWQWVHAGNFSRERVLAEIEPWRAQYPEAAELFEQVALSDDFVEFLGRSPRTSFSTDRPLDEGPSTTGRRPTCGWAISSPPASGPTTGPRSS